MSVASPTDPRPQQPRRFLWFYLPDLSLLRRAPVQMALLANFLSGLAIGTLSYGAMVHLARSGGSQFEIALVSAASFLPGLVLGTQGGLIAPFIMLPMLIGIIIGSYRFSEEDAPGGLEVLASFWEEDN